MITNRNQNLLIIATALVVAAGLLVIPAVTQQESHAVSIQEKLQKSTG